MLNMFKTIKRNNIEKIKELINGADVNIQNEDGDTLLHYAINDENYEIVKLLLEHSANVNAKDYYGDTPLHNTNNYEIAKLLIEYGANVNAKNEFGSTPLHDVSDYNTTKLLIDNGADMNVKNKYGDIPLHLAIRHEQDYYIRLLLSYY